VFGLPRAAGSFNPRHGKVKHPDRALVKTSMEGGFGLRDFG